MLEAEQNLLERTRPGFGLEGPHRRAAVQRRLRCAQPLPRVVRFAGEDTLRMCGYPRDANNAVPLPAR